MEENIEVWLHCTSPEVAKDILENGFSPDRNSQTKFGCGVYLSTERWHEDDGKLTWAVLECTVDLSSAMVCEYFPPSDGFSEGGRTERHFGRWLKEQGVVSSNRVQQSAGNSPQNARIKEFMKEKNYHAAKFLEHGKEVLVIYDASLITSITLVESGASGSNST